MTSLYCFIDSAIFVDAPEIINRFPFTSISSNEEPSGTVIFELAETREPKSRFSPINYS